MLYRLPSLAALAVLTLAVPVARAEGKKSDSPPFVHIVIFYLKADAPGGAADEILTDCHEMLAKISTVRALKAGRPAEGTSALVKKDYAVGLTILFDDAEAYKKYTTDPLHLKFVQKYGKYFDTSKLAVYDFADGKK